MAAVGDHILEDLYSALEEEPKNVYVHERLVEVWKEIGDKERTSEAALALMEIDPNNALAQAVLGASESTKTVQIFGPGAGPSRHDSTTKPLPPVLDSWTKVEKFLSEGYNTLKLEAQLLEEEIASTSSLAPTSTDDEVLTNLRAISKGHLSSVLPMAQPLSVREVARRIQSSPTSSQAHIIDDFESIIQWASFQTPPLSTDATRSRLIKRKTLLEAALPTNKKDACTAAFQAVERKHLDKKYENTETMYGDAFSDVPPENFFVSEDNYAWDMDELAQAITAGGCVMRNPLSKQLFTDSDIKRILAHPLGRRLKLGRDEQAQYRKGVRQATVDWCAKLGKIMLEDQSVDTKPSKLALDEFQAYVAMLPEAEQKTIQKMKVPGVDSTSRQPFDYTIGESVKDAIANTTCLHKVGDFLSQAAVYLKKQ